MKSSKEEVQISYEDYCKLIEEIPLPIVVSSIGDNRCLYMNQHAADLFEVPGQKVLEGYTNDYYVDPARRQQLLDCLRAAGQVQNFEVLLKTKSGRTFCTYISSTMTVFKDNLAVCSVFNDNTDRERAEADVRNANRKLEQIINFLPDATFVIDKSGKVIAWNRSIEQLTGIPQAEMIAKSDYEYSIPFYGERRPIMIDLVLLSDADFEKSNYDAFQRRGDTIFAEYYVPGAYAGKGAYLMGTASPLLDEEGNIVGAIESLRDVTGHKRLEEALRESEECFRALSENVPDIVFTMNLDGAITYVNPSWKRVLGHEKGEIIGHYFVDFAKEDDKSTYRRIFKNFRNEGGNITNHIGVLLTKEGMERELNINMAFNLNSKGQRIGVVNSMQDITEFRNMENKLNQARKMESIGTLAGGIAHNFNNLLMGIQGYASLMLLDLDQSHRHYEWLKRIEDQIASGASLTKQLLGFAQGGRYEVKPSNMNNVIVKTAMLFGRTNKDIDIHQRLEQCLWTVDVDRGQMEEVLLNLYVNASQAMPDGGDLYLETENVILDEQAMPYTINAGKYVKVSITDTGTGMDEKTRAQIFDPFFTTKDMSRGAGLGLPMAYGIIKGHKGIIDVRSDPGHGTTFHIYLPVSGKEVVIEEPVSVEVIQRKETILLVDDENMTLEVTKELLESLGYRIYAAGSGQDAIALYVEKKDEIALVILDMIMPGISGGETFDRLRKIDADVRVILSSGYSLEGRAQQILDRGCNGFIQKPFNLDKLSAKVREILD
ncbi:MAG: PAS domain S-box protein [Syntrophales bacterium]